MAEAALEPDGDSDDDSVDDPVGSLEDGEPDESVGVIVTTTEEPAESVAVVTMTVTALDELVNIGVSPGGIDMIPVSVEASVGKSEMMTEEGAIVSLMGKMLMMPSSPSGC